MEWTHLLEKCLWEGKEERNHMTDGNEGRENAWTEQETEIIG
jgi:hypothetical protein